MRLKDVVLALVVLHPGATGYDLRTVIRKSTGYLFSASLSQIYPALGELHRAGLIEFETVDVAGGPSRKLYSITPQGADVVTKLLEEPIDFPPDYGAFHLLLLRLALMGSRDVEATRRVCEHALDHFRAERERIGAGGMGPSHEFLLAPAAARQAFDRVWDPELAFILDDLDRKIAWIGDLLASLADEDSAL